MSDQKALLQQAHNYRKGCNGCEQDGEKALHLYLQLLEEGVKCYNEIGLIYKNGIPPVQQDLQNAIAYFTQDIENKLCLYNLGTIYQDKSCEFYAPQKSLDCFLAAAEHGHSASCVRAAKALIDGIDVQHDFQKAVSLLEAAIEMDNTNACFYLGQFLAFKAPDEMRDLKRAAMLLCRVEKENSHYATAQRFYGNLMRKGICGWKNEIAEYQSYLEAAANGDKISLRLLGDCCCGGIGREPDFSAARDYYEQAQAAGVKNIDKHLQQLAAIEEKAGIVYCPCCGRPMEEHDGRLTCRRCSVRLSTSAFPDVRFIYHYNLSNMYRQSKMYYDAMYHSSILTSKYPNVIESWWSDLLSRYGICFIVDSIYYHIDRMNMDTMLFDPAFTRIMKLSEGEEKTEYCNFVMEMDSVMRKNQEYIHRYKMNQASPLLICYDPDDMRALAYVKMLKMEYEKMGINPDDINQIDQYAGFDVRESCYAYAAVRYATAMLLIASSKEYLNHLDNMFMRFGEYKQWDANKLLFTVAAGEREKIFGNIFAGSSAWTDKTPPEEVARVTTLAVGKNFASYQSIDLASINDSTGTQLLKEIQKIRALHGKDPIPEDSGSFIRAHHVNYTEKNDERFIPVKNVISLKEGRFIRFTYFFAKPIKTETSMHFNVKIYNMDDEMVQQLDMEIALHPGNDHIYSSFKLLNENQIPFFPIGLYYVVAEFGNGCRSVMAIAVVENETDAAYRRLADAADIPVPQSAWNLSEYEKQRARLAEAAIEYTARVTADVPFSFLAVKQIKTRKLFKEIITYTIYLMKPDGKVMHAIVGKNGIESHFEERGDIDFSSIQHLSFNDKQEFKHQNDAAYPIENADRFQYDMINITPVLWNEFGFPDYIGLDYSGMIRCEKCHSDHPSLQRSWLEKQTIIYKKIFSLEYTLYGVTFDDRIETIAGNDELHLEELFANLNS